MDLNNLALEGAELTLAEAEQLELLCDSQPNDIGTRFKLIGYYFRHSFCCEQARRLTVKHLLWVVENMPDADIAYPFLLIDVFFDRVGFRTVKEAWIARLERTTAVRAVVNLGHFVHEQDPQLALELFRRAVEEEPGNSEWVNALARHTSGMDELIVRGAMFDDPEPDFEGTDCSHQEQLASTADAYGGWLSIKAGDFVITEEVYVAFEKAGFPRHALDKFKAAARGRYLRDVAVRFFGRCFYRELRGLPEKILSVKRLRTMVLEEEALWRQEQARMTALKVSKDDVIEYILSDARAFDRIERY